jgi:hypothetical protein
MRRMAGALALGAALGIGASRQGTPRPAALTGADWKALGSAERSAYLNGFLAGAAAEQVRAAAADSAAATAAAIARLESRHALHFPYAPAVYSVQLDDYYFYVDRVPTPIVDVLIAVNRRMLEPDR